MSNGQKITVREGRELEREVLELFFDKFAEHGHKPDKGVEVFKKAIEERLRKEGLHNTNLKIEIINIYKNWASGKISRRADIYDGIANAICKYVDTGFLAKVKDFVIGMCEVVGNVDKVFTRPAEELLHKQKEKK